MKSRLITTAAAVAVAGGALAAGTGTASADAADIVRIASIQTDSVSTAAAKSKKFNAQRPWGAARGVLSLKRAQGWMVDRKADGRCVRVTVYWGVKKPGKKGRIYDTDRVTACGLNATKRIDAAPDYKGRRFKANGALITFKLLPRR